MTNNVTQVGVAQVAMPNLRTRMAPKQDLQNSAQESILTGVVVPVQLVLQVILRPLRQLRVLMRQVVHSHNHIKQVVISEGTAMLPV